MSSNETATETAALPGPAQPPPTRRPAALPKDIIRGGSGLWLWVTWALLPVPHLSSCETLDYLIPLDVFSKAETVTSSQDARFKKGLGLEGTACPGTPLSLHLLGLQGLSRRLSVQRAGVGESVLGPASSLPTALPPGGSDSWELHLCQECETFPNSESC